MKIQEARSGEVRILTPDGDLHSADECAALDQQFGTVLGQAARFVVLDLSQVGQLGGPALRSLLLAARKLQRRSGRMVLCRLTAHVQRVFAVSGLDRDVLLADSIEDAVRIVAQPGAAPPRPGAQSPAAASGSDALSALAELVRQAIGPDTSGESAAAPAAPSPERAAEAVPDALVMMVLEALTADLRAPRPPGSMTRPAAPGGH
jgi:anti-anti-sigma factor